MISKESAQFLLAILGQWRISPADQNADPSWAIAVQCRDELQKVIANIAERPV